MYCDWSFYCKYSWKLVWLSCYQRCVIHVYVEWSLHVLVFNGLLFPWPANMQILQGQERCRNKLLLNGDENAYCEVWGYVGRNFEWPTYIHRLCSNTFSIIARTYEWQLWLPFWYLSDKFWRCFTLSLAAECSV